MQLAKFDVPHFLYPYRDLTSAQKRFNRLQAIQKTSKELDRKHGSKLQTTDEAQVKN